MESLNEDIQRTADFLLENADIRPEVAVICGTGLGSLPELLTEIQVFDYTDIPGFPICTVKGHAGKLVFGLLKGKPCVCMKGRFHQYEGTPPYMTTFPIRVFSLLGVKTLVVTCAAGGLNQTYKVGDFMIIRDHINLAAVAGINPLVGRNLDNFGPRFVGMGDAYDRKLRKLAWETAEELGFDSFTRKGVYVMQMGPAYETPAEYAFLRGIGGDVAGMSTAPEVMVAKHCGMRCLGISLVTNMGMMEVLDEVEEKDIGDLHTEVVAVAEKRGKEMAVLVERIVGKFKDIRYCKA